MKKMKLDLDMLAVESFETDSAGGVVGFDTTAATDCYACDGGGSGDAFCAESGEMTCGTIGCPNSAFPCQSVNACNTDANTCLSICPCTNVTCAGGPGSCDPRCTQFYTCDGGPRC